MNLSKTEIEVLRLVAELSEAELVILEHGVTCALGRELTALHDPGLPFDPPGSSGKAE